MIVVSDSGLCLNLNRIDDFTTDIPETENGGFVGVLIIFLEGKVEKVTIQCSYVFEALVETLSKRKKNKK